MLQQRAGFGHGTARAPRAENLAPKTPPKPKAEAQAQARGRRATAAVSGQRRPTRSSLQGERAPGSAGGVRRVVIDSQASRRQGPGGGPAAVPVAAPAAARPNRPPRRRGGRRRRGTYEEPVAQDVSSLKADVIRVNSGSTVKDVAGVRSAWPCRRSSRS